MPHQVEHENRDGDLRLLWQCDVCGRLTRRQDEAEQCENRRAEETMSDARIGNVILAQRSYHNVDEAQSGPFPLIVRTHVQRGHNIFPVYEAANGEIIEGSNEFQEEFSYCSQMMTPQEARALRESLVVLV